MKQLSDELRRVIRGEVLDDQATRDAYSGDYSIFKVMPQAVAFPRDTDDVKKLVRFAAAKRAHDAGISLTARSAGTDMSGGPLNDSVIVEFTKHMNRVREVGADYAVVEPGAYFRDFEKEIEKRGLFYPPYPASKDLCAIGGIVANNSGGEKTLAYGKTEKYVEALTVVLRDGEAHTFTPIAAAGLTKKLKEKGIEGDIYRKLYKLIEGNYDVIRRARPNVSKNSSGYPLWNVWDRKTFDIIQLFVGSQGTLGLITEARLRLLKKPNYRRLAVIFAKSLDPVPGLVRALLRFNPESIESYDDRTLGLALKFLPSLLRLMKGNIVTLGLQFLPELMMVLRGGLPKMVLLVELASDDERELAGRMNALYAEVKKFPVQLRVTRREEEAQKYWTIRRQSFNLLHSHVKRKDAVAFVDDIIVLPEYMPEVLPKVNAIMDRYKDKFLYTIAGHPGGGNFHIIPLADLKDPQVRALIPKIAKEVYELVLRYKGSISGEHNDGLIRTPYLEMMYGKKIYGLFGEVKKIFDPDGIFNPRKKFGADLAYMTAHIKR
ncbi:MAG: hypothetical protein A3A43_00040 [Candidatus Liptonbacteria bacterium RIFCSPLOWO2_01_FULL_56_20]|uniref:FAD-binding PCMH-type domain-containing protein n=1 Tax=Candidatus Liptonbacteria bacterium RIFCSPLOWO2_01_FULL_56_20 TaxID=1798652 RepID=A0A1G2CK45_9BACT|nr:MAG: hypothetical protein A2681_02340 [Candidatus Liptonbacteria bacterium RIFCSPHIGHO2_01_FULL_56_18b]OGZ01776.1 MAG: hypothetical protein A3A43_00040 [Candidatus Liptonbacteria bacterium RIFCSPLOWO2_01_FULL_56_20]